MNIDRDFKPGDIVRHFKWETCTKEEQNNSMYLYEIKCFATHTETNEKMVVYQALYPPFNIYTRPYDMFVSKVDTEKYPNINQPYRLMLSTATGELIIYD